MANSLEFGRNDERRLHQHKRLGGLVQHEQVDAPPERHHQRRLRTIDEESGGDLLFPGLPERQRRVMLGLVDHRQDRKDGPDRRVDIEIGRAVQGVDGDGDDAASVEQGGDLLFLGQIGADSGLSQRRREQLLGHQIQALLSIAVDVDAAGGLAEATAQGGAARTVEREQAAMAICRTAAATAAFVAGAAPSPSSDFRRVSRVAIGSMSRLLQLKRGIPPLGRYIAGC